MFQTYWYLPCVMSNHIQLFLSWTPVFDLIPQLEWWDFDVFHRLTSLFGQYILPR